MLVVPTDETRDHHFTIAYRSDAHTHYPRGICDSRAGILQAFATDAYETRPKPASENPYEPPVLSRHSRRFRSESGVICGLLVALSGPTGRRLFNRKRFHGRRVCNSESRRHDERLHGKAAHSLPAVGNQASSPKGPRASRHPPRRICYQRSGRTLGFSLSV